VTDIDQPFGQARLTVELSPQAFNVNEPIVVQMDRALDNIVEIAAHYFRMPQLAQAYLSVTMELTDNIRLIPNVQQNPLLLLAQVALATAPNRQSLLQRYGHSYGASRLFRNEQDIRRNLRPSLEEALHNLTNSDETIQFDDLVFELRFDTPMVVGARGKLKSVVKRTIASDCETGGLYKYDFEDGLCGFQAVIFALVAKESLREMWTGWSTWLYEAFDGCEFSLESLKRDPVLFAELASQLRFHMGLPDGSEWLVGCGRNSTANLFCIYQPRMQIVIFNEVTRQVIEQRRGLLFDSTKAKDSTILLSFTLGHLHLIRGANRYFGQNIDSNSKFCYNCLLFKYHDRHKCNKVPQCDRCFLQFTSEEHREIHTTWESTGAACERCDITFYNSRCMGSHHCRAQHIRLCEQCGKKVYPNREHVCGEYTCVNCRAQVDSDHRCFMKTMPRPEKDITAKEAGNNYYAFDLESMFRQRENDGGYLHEVNLVVLRRCFDDSPNAEIVMHSLDEFVRWMENQVTPCTLFAHNMKGYDGRMVFDYLFDRHCPPQEILWRGSKILRMTYGKVSFMDTLLHLPASLAELPKMFGLDTAQFKKGYFPYRFNLPENQDYVGPLPAKEYFDPDMMSSKNRRDFERWYDEQAAASIEYDFAKELREYCQSDVRILCKAIETYMTEQMRNYSLNPFDSITIASYAMAMYRTYFMPEESMCVLKTDEHENIARSMHGGRTDTRCLLREWTEEEVAQGIYGKYQDVQSLYPTVQFYDPLPVGPPSKRVFTDEEQPTVTQLMQVFGFVCCDIEPTKYLHHPIIVEVNDEGRLVADLLPKQNIVVPTPELHLALRYGYRVTKVYWWYEFKSSTSLFKSYFRTFLKAKIEASGVPDWVGDDPNKWEEFRKYHAEQLGIELDRSRMVKNNSKKAGAKLLCNSLWGKFGERNKVSMWQTFALGEMDDRIIELERKWIAGDIDIEFRRYSGNKETVGMVYSYVNELPTSHVMQKKRRGHKNIAVASMITSHARCRLWTELNKLGDRVLYHDTDSIVYEHRPNEYNIPNGRYLGEWEVEEDGLPLVKFVSTGPKCYSYAVLQSDGKLRTKTKVKGITMTDYNSRLINYDGMKAMVIGELDEVKAKALLFKYSRQHGTMQTDTVPKIFKLTYRKGWIDRNNWKVYPFGWEKFLPPTEAQK
jgi:hypothetical protein